MNLGCGLFHPPSHLLPLLPFLSPFSSLVFFCSNFLFSEWLHISGHQPPGWCVAYWTSHTFRLLFAKASRPYWVERAGGVRPTFHHQQGLQGVACGVLHSGTTATAVWHQANCFISLVPQCSHLYNESNKITLLNWIFWGIQQMLA